MSGILRLESLTKGNTLKQGDKTPLKYRLFDADGEKLNIAGKTAKVRLVYPDFLTIGYEKGGLTVGQDDTVTFTIDGVIPSRIYHVEIIVDGQFIFPSRADESKFTVDKSSLGTEANIIEIVGVDAVVRKAVDLINQDPSLIIDEDKLVSDIISSTGIGSIEEYYQQFNDVIKELAEDKDYHSLPEIAGARRGYQTLNESLNNLSFGMFNTNLGKVTPNMVSDELLAQIAGDAAVNAVPADGSLTTEKYAHESVTPKKTTFMKMSKNLFNPLDPDVLTGKYYDASNVLITNENITQTGFIPVEGGRNYTATYNTGTFNWYDDNKALISATLDWTASGYATAPTNAKYARLTTHAYNWSTLQVEEGTVSTPFEPYFEPYFEPEFIVSNSITPEKTTFVKKGKNLMNPLDIDIVYGGYYDASNVLITNENINQTGFIPVYEGSAYTATYKTGLVNWYNKDKTVIASIIPGFENPGYVIAPRNAKYVRFLTTPANWSTFQVEEGTVSTPFEPYTGLELDSDIVIRKESVYPPIVDYSPAVGIDSGWNGKKWVSFGDSITFQNSWQPHVVDVFGLVHTNCGIGSTSLAGDEPLSFHKDTRLDTVKNANPDVVTILGGANDLVDNILIGDETEFSKALSSKDTDNFLGAYSYIIENLLTWKPTLRIILLTTTWAHDDGDLMPHTTGLKYTDYALATEKVAKYYGLPYVDLHGEAGFGRLTKDTYIPDGIHPNDTGGKRIAELVIGKLKSIDIL